MSKAQGLHQQPWRRPWWLAFLDKTNLIVTGLTAGFLLYTRSVGVAYFSAGGVACSLSVKLIKHFIRQPRPTHLSQRKSSFGMPSTHSAAITYYATYIPLACIYLPMHVTLPAGFMLRLIPPIVIVPWSALIALSRIWLGHHTWPQVAVGCSYGFIFAYFWFNLWTQWLNEYGQPLEEYLYSVLK